MAIPSRTLLRGLLHVFFVACLFLGWAPPATAQDDNDPHIGGGGQRFRDNREVSSPVILNRPIYACTDTVVVRGFVVGAELRVFVAGNPAPIGTAIGTLPDGQPIKVTSGAFTVGQVVTARQVVTGIPGPPSNAVTVTSHRDDYPTGLPQPRVDPVPCYNCGRAIGVADVIPGAWWKVFAEDPQPGGGFGPRHEIGGNQDFSYTFVPALHTGQRITVDTGICADRATSAAAQIVSVEPATIPPPALDPVFAGADRVVMRGPGGTSLVNGASLEVRKGLVLAGGQPTPGGAQEILIDPRATSGSYTPSEALCGLRTTGTPVPVQPCSRLPAPKIRKPVPGDAVVEVTQSQPGARIHIYDASGTEIGDGSGSLIALVRPVTDGDMLTVVQWLGDCHGELVHRMPVACNDRDPAVCSSDWPAFRHSGLRDGQQRVISALADPLLVKQLEVRWSWSPPEAARFRASPIVSGGRVFVGGSNGRMYALNANTGALQWQFPASADAALTSAFTCNPSSDGIAASAVIARVRERAAVVFGAPDRSIGARLGSGRLFALEPSSGSVIWRSGEIAVLSGATPTNTKELHEQIGYSSPLVVGNRIYVGLANHCDNPIQNGRVVAVDAASGSVIAPFSYRSTSTRGGGVWSSIAGGLDPNAVFVTTGNARQWNGGSQSEPSVNHSLSMLRLNSATGAVEWKLQPVPFALDDDPDWASGATLVDGRCGATVASTQKDGWSYSASTTGSGSSAVVRWQFPPTGIPFTGGVHGDTRYLKTGGAWRDTYVTLAGGYAVEAGDVRPGYTRLHAFDVCGPRNDPIRWIADIPDTTRGSPYQMGNPSLTHGIVFVGTTSGHLIALADPSVWPASGSLCTNPEVTTAECAAHGLRLVPRPHLLKDIDLGAGAIVGEPAIASGHVFVATEGGRVFMLAPRGH